MILFPAVVELHPVPGIMLLPGCTLGLSISSEKHEHHLLTCLLGTAGQPRQMLQGRDCWTGKGALSSPSHVERQEHSTLVKDLPSLAMRTVCQGGLAHAVRNNANYPVAEGPQVYLPLRARCTQPQLLHPRTQLTKQLDLERSWPS